MVTIALALKLFADFRVECVVIGGVAAGVRGSSQATFDGHLLRPWTSRILLVWFKR